MFGSCIYRRQVVGKEDNLRNSSLPPKSYRMKGIFESYFLALRTLKIRDKFFLFKYTVPKAVDDLIKAYISNSTTLRPT